MRRPEHEADDQGWHGDALVALGMLMPGTPSEIVRVEYESIQGHCYDTARALTEYCTAEDVSGVIFIDKTARLAQVALDEYWRLTQAGDPPDMHFISPIVPRWPVDLRFDQPIWMQAVWAEFAANITGTELTQTDPLLWGKRDQPILLFDSCIHSGMTLYWTRRALSRNGFTDIRTGVYEDQSYGEGLLKPDLLVAPEGQLTTCVPFGYDLSIVDQEGSIHTATHPEEVMQQMGFAGREAIRMMISERLAAGG